MILQSYLLTLINNPLIISYFDNEGDPMKV